MVRLRQALTDGICGEIVGTTASVTWRGIRCLTQAEELHSSHATGKSAWTINISRKGHRSMRKVQISSMRESDSNEDATYLSQIGAYPASVQPQSAAQSVLSSIFDDGQTSSNVVVDHAIIHTSPVIEDQNREVDIFQLNFWFIKSANTAPKTPPTIIKAEPAPAVAAEMKKAFS